MSLVPNTTEEQDRTTHGQRRINMIWEVTQAIIAVVVTVANVVVGVHHGLTDPSLSVPPILSNAFFLIVGFYFSRVNHNAIGGIGPKATDYQEYKGR